MSLQRIKVQQVALAVQSLQHAREHLERRRAGDLGKRLMALVQDIKPEPEQLDRLVVKSGGRVFFLRTQELDWIEAAGNYVKLHGTMLDRLYDSLDP